MKEELIRVLNNRLDSINSDITSLNELNSRITEENEILEFVNSVLDSFKENDTNEPMNIDRVNKDDFNRALEIVGEEVAKLFNGDICNYDGLVYLISGIRSGIAITLTNEQVNSIEFLIQSLTDKKREIENIISGYQDEVNKYEISDVGTLENKRDNYLSLKDNVDRNEYIKDIDLIKEAINYSELDPSNVIGMLSYILDYNANLYKANKPISTEVEKEVEEEVETEVQVPEEEKEVEIPTTTEETNEVELPKESVDPMGFDFVKAFNLDKPKEEEIPVDVPEDNEFHFEQINNDELFNSPITFNDEPKEEQEEKKEEKIDYNSIPIEQITFGESLDNNFNNDTDNNDTDNTGDDDSTSGVTGGFKSFDEIINSTLNNHNDVDYVPLTDYANDENNFDQPVVELPSYITDTTNVDTDSADEEDSDDYKDFGGDQKEEEVRDEKAISTRELHKIFGKYGIEENVILNELIDGDINEYQAILDSLKEHSILDDFKKNKELLVETLLYSNTAVIERVLNIIKEDLSTDDEDYEITLRIAINTIPSIFIKEGGNYDNFIANTELFKHLELNLINLFDFSKEVFIADSEAVKRNYDIINDYNFDVTYQNAKYFLLIPNIEDKLDYYIESVYEDKIKNETFDGINYIKEFAAKLNVVTDETIKRLRYASVNGRKVFGSKPGALTGEITNLKVNTLEMNDIYLNSFFDNEFKDITPEEVREYVKLTRNSTNVGDYSDELDKLNIYRNGLRYTIDGINVSYNKVVRNYNILRSYGIDAKKALQYAVCHNLVITKDEYSKLSELLDNIGGNI